MKMHSTNTFGGIAKCLFLYTDTYRKTQGKLNRMANEDRGMLI